MANKKPIKKKSSARYYPKPNYRTLPKRWERSHDAWCDFCFHMRKDCISVRYPRADLDICFGCLDRIFNSRLVNHPSVKEK